MELTTYHLALAFVINRMVEAIKQALPPENVENPTRIDRWRNVGILLLSFVLGAVIMNTVFPTHNLFPEAVTPLAGLSYTGILVGGVANGWDMLGKFGRAALDRVQGATAVVALEGVEVTVEADEAEVKAVA